MVWFKYLKLGHSIRTCVTSTTTNLIIVTSQPKLNEILIITVCVNKCFVRTGDLNYHNFKLYVVKEEKIESNKRKSASAI